MLVNFTFRNFRSFRDEATLSMEAASIQELAESVVSICGEELLPVAVMYGANSSGKSNVLKALKAMRDVLLNSVKLNPKDKLYTDTFCLDLTSAEEPTSFEIQFTIRNSRFRYGFEYTQDVIVAEWLYEKRVGEREFELFLRSGDEYKISKTRFAEGIGKQSATPANRLFVSLVAQLNGNVSQTILDWFSNMEYLSGLYNDDYADKTLKMVYDESEGYSEVLEFLGKAHLGFNGLSIIKDSSREKQMEAKSIHNIFDKEGNVVGKRQFPVDEMESEGSKKMIEIAGPIVDAIMHGKILIVDELDAKLHPFLTRKIIGLFMDKVLNPNHAQLIFATHDTNMLNLQYLRRDQIWFTEKERTDASELYSLVEFRDEAGNKVRNDRNIEKDYINGRYGAVPFMS